MAAVTQANVTKLSFWDEGTATGALVQACRRVVVAMNANGGTALDMPASLFSLAEIYEVESWACDAAGTLTSVPVILDLDPTTKVGRGVLTCNPATGALGNVTSGNLYMTVKGRSL